MARTDVLLVSLGGTAGLRAADDALAGALRRAGASVAVARVAPTRELRTFALTDLAWALPARRAAARAAIRDARPRAIVYSTHHRGAAVAGAAARSASTRRRRATAPAATGSGSGRSSAAGSRRRRCCCRGARARSPRRPPPRAGRSSCRCPSARLGPRRGERDLAAITYGANPHKKGLDRVLAAWRAARRPGETLVVAGLAGSDEDGVRFAGMLAPRRVPRAAAPRARVRHRAAPRGLRDRAARGARRRRAARHDRGARPLRGAPARPRARPAARRRRPRRGDPHRARRPGCRATPSARRRAVAPWTPAAVDALVAERLLPALLEGRCRISRA